MLLLPREQLWLVAPPRVEMDVLDAADVVNRVHQDAAPQRLACTSRIKVALVVGSVNAVVGFNGSTAAPRGFFPASRWPHGWGLGSSAILVRIIEHHAFQRAVVWLRVTNGGPSSLPACSSDVKVVPSSVGRRSRIPEPLCAGTGSQMPLIVTAGGTVC